MVDQVPRTIQFFSLSLFLFLFSFLFFRFLFILHSICILTNQQFNLQPYQYTLFVHETRNEMEKSRNNGTEKHTETHTHKYKLHSPSCHKQRGTWISFSKRAKSKRSHWFRAVCVYVWNLNKNILACALVKSKVSTFKFVFLMCVSWFIKFMLFDILFCCGTSSFALHFACTCTQHMPQMCIQYCLKQ